MTMVNQFLVTKIIPTTTWQPIDLKIKRDRPGAANVHSSVAIKQRDPKILLMKDKSLTLTFQNLTWKSMGNIYSRKATIVPNEITTCTCIKKEVIIYWVDNTWNYNQFGLDLWSPGLKINWDHPLTKNNHSSKFG